MTAKQAFLYSLIASVVVSAMLGIFAILTGNWGELEIRIILTTVTIAGASLAGLACGAYLETGRSERGLPLGGIGLAVLAGALILLGIWVELDSEAYWKFTVIASVYAIALAHLCLLSMARLAEAFRWSLPAAFAVILGVASLISLMLLFEIDESGMFRILGVAAILDATITILVPVFHRLSRGDLGAAGESIDLRQLDAEIARVRSELEQLEARRDAALAGVAR
jgi:hypothetical protein